MHYAAFSRLFRTNYACICLETKQNTSISSSYKRKNLTWTSEWYEWVELYTLIQDSWPPPIQAAASRMRFGPPWFRPVSEPLGYFRLFVLLIVDLTRIQPNIQRSALYIHGLVCLTWINLHRLVHELVFCQVLGQDGGVFIQISRFLARLMAAMYAIRVVIGYVCSYVDGDGPSTFTPASAFSSTSVLKCTFVVSGVCSLNASVCPCVNLTCTGCVLAWGVCVCVCVFAEGKPVLFSL